MLLKHHFLCSSLLLLVCSSGSKVNLVHGDNTFLFIQDVCGSDEKLKDAAQSVFPKYMSLLKNSNKFFIGTNNPSLSEIKVVETVGALNKAMEENRAASVACESNVGATLESFYLTLKQSVKLSNDVNREMARVNIAHVTTVGASSYMGAHFAKLVANANITMRFIGVTEKNEYFENSHVFNAFPGEFSQTYDPEVALLHLVNTFGSDKKAPLPDPAITSRCIKNLQLAFLFHTDISSVPGMADYRAKAQSIFQSVPKYFDIPASNIDQDDETCDFDKSQEANKTLFFGSIYANSSSLLVPTFCYSNMDSYPNTVASAKYLTADQVTLQSVIDSYAKFYNTDIKMKCKCFDYQNPDTTKIVMWTPLSPKSLDAGPVSFDGFKLAGFQHIVMPFGFSYDDSPLWRSLVPDRDMWLTDASKANYDVEEIIQDIWTITCRLAGTIEETQTAEPYNPYTTKKPKTGN